jgi:hypothetical protein
MTLCIAHNDAGRQTVVVDCLREAKPPFSPEQTVGEFSELLKAYCISKIQSDRYGGIWPVEQFSKFAVVCEQAAKPKSELYLNLLPLVMSRRIELLDHQRLFSQLINLERRSVRGGRDTVDHSPGSHDDIVNCVAGVAAMITAKPHYNLNALAGINDESDPDGARAWRKQKFLEHIMRYG